MATSTGLSLWQDARRRLLQNRLAVAGTIFLVAIALISIIGPFFSPYSYDMQDLRLGATSPSSLHWLGTDVLGRDVLTRLMYGGRLSLLVGLAGTSVALIIGVSWGCVAGFVGGKVDDVMMRMVDVLYALPFSVFIILLSVLFGHSLILLFLAIGAVEWLNMARVVRSQIATIKQQEYIEAARSMGVANVKILTRHMLPNTLGTIVVYATLTVPNVILLESFLSFLGLGIQAPQSSWGSLISSGVENMEEYPWLLIFPAMCLSLSLFSLNFLGDGLRDALDPKSSVD